MTRAEDRFSARGGGMTGRIRSPAHAGSNPPRRCRPTRTRRPRIYAIWAMLPPASARTVDLAASPARRMSPSPAMRDVRESEAPPCPGPPRHAYGRPVRHSSAPPQPSPLPDCSSAPAAAVEGTTPPIPAPLLPWHPPSSSPRPRQIHPATPSPPQRARPTAPTSAPPRPPSLTPEAGSSPTALSPPVASARASRPSAQLLVLQFMPTGGWLPHIDHRDRQIRGVRRRRIGQSTRLSGRRSVGRCVIESRRRRLRGHRP